VLHDSLFFSDFSMQMIHSSQPLYETNVRLNLRRARTRTILLSTNLKSTRVRRSMRVLLQPDFEPTFRHSAWLRLASKFEHS